MQAADHVLGEELVPFVGSGQVPFAQLGGLQGHLLLGLLRGDAAAVEEDVRQGCRSHHLARRLEPAANPDVRLCPLTPSC
jgi:hypothetical protein